MDFVLNNKNNMLIKNYILKVSFKLFNKFLLPNLSITLTEIKESYIVTINNIFKQTTPTILLNKLFHYHKTTFVHSVRVAAMSYLFNIFSNNSFNNIEDLYLGALLHDIGKLNIDLDILDKPSSLTKSEFAIIQSHPSSGLSMLIDSASISSAVKMIISQHHERINGSGYPNSLSENNITFYSKIVAVIDVYDALSSERPYKKTFSPIECLEYLYDNIGVQFDKDIVTKFSSLINFYSI